MIPRAGRLEVRNPMLQLPSLAALQTLDPVAREALRAILLDLRTDARSRADRSWASRKPPMAAYWAAVAVYAGHLARVLA
jgi:hypothetical protein